MEGCSATQTSNKFMGSRALRLTKSSPLTNARHKLVRTLHNTRWLGGAQSSWPYPVHYCYVCPRFPLCLLYAIYLLFSRDRLELTTYLLV